MKETIDGTEIDAHRARIEKIKVTYRARRWEYDEITQFHSEFRTAIWQNFDIMLSAIVDHARTKVFTSCRVRPTF